MSSDVIKDYKQFRKGQIFFQERYLLNVLALIPLILRALQSKTSPSATIRVDEMFT
jgi:hypothetical protein